jgi:hypothetical protein
MNERYDNATAIDPQGCGCTECLVGEYVPLERATNRQIQRMLKGKLDDHTGERFTKTITHYPGAGKDVTVAAEYSGLSWSWVK